MTIIEILEQRTGLPSWLLRSFANNEKDYYKRVNLPKKSGGYRRVYVPTVELKLAQTFLTEAVLSSLPIHESAKAYRRGCNTKMNAVIHAGNQHFLFGDFKEFFDSIDFVKMFELVRNQGLAYEGQRLSCEDVEMVLKLCSRYRRFVQGCPSSPLLSNFYMLDFDKSLSDIASRLPNGKYTRYSDDFVVSSSEHIPQEILNTIRQKAASLWLTLNENKTFFSSRKSPITVTGIRIRNDSTLGLSTAFKKELKNQIYHFLKNGENKKCGLTKEAMLGRLSYLRLIDPAYFNRVNRKYARGDLLLFDLIKAMGKDQR